MATSNCNGDVNRAHVDFCLSSIVVNSSHQMDAIVTEFHSECNSGSCIWGGSKSTSMAVVNEVAYRHLHEGQQQELLQVLVNQNNSSPLLDHCLCRRPPNKKLEHSVVDTRTQGQFGLLDKSINKELLPLTDSQEPHPQQRLPRKEEEEEDNQIVVDQQQSRRFVQQDFLQQRASPYRYPKYQQQVERPAMTSYMKLRDRTASCLKLVNRLASSTLKLPGLFKLRNSHH